MAEFSKGGAVGAFHIRTLESGAVECGMSEAGPSRHFDNAQTAHDHYRPFTQDNHSAFNICYHLEDLIGESA